MKLSEYQLAAIRTMAEKDNKRDNLIHMEAGVIGEIGELVDCFKKTFAYGKEFDKVNAGEEIADAMWYLANTANIQGIYLKDEVINQYEKVFDFDLAFEFSRRAISQIDMVYTQYNPSEASINYFIYRLVIIADYLQIDFEEILESNINKLKHRFPDKFSSEKALNRDLEGERKILEGETIKI